MGKLCFIFYSTDICNMYNYNVTRRYVCNTAIKRYQNNYRLYDINYRLYKRANGWYTNCMHFCMWVIIIWVHELQIKQHSGVLLNWSKTAFVNTVFKLIKHLFSYTRLNAKLWFGKTSFVNTAVNVLSLLATL